MKNRLGRDGIGIALATLAAALGMAVMSAARARATSCAGDPPRYGRKVTLVGRTIDGTPTNALPTGGPARRVESSTVGAFSLHYMGRVESYVDR